VCDGTLRRDPTISTWFRARWNGGSGCARRGSCWRAGTSAGPSSRPGRRSAASCS
jgi:hypothetical protein